MDGINEGVRAFLLDPANHDILTIVKAIRNGLVYGTKIRFPHALVMVILFRSGTLREKALAIFKATRQHALNLATFALIYKSLMLLLRHAAGSAIVAKRSPRPSAEPSAHSFLAGLAAGYWVFGRRAVAHSSVTQQIVIYVFARVVLGLAKLAVAPAGPAPDTLKAGYGDVQRGGLGLLDALLNAAGVAAPERRELVKARVRRDAWPVFAGVSWGMVMWLFRWHPDVLQPSLRGSMKYIYDNAERWDGVRNWIFQNE